MPHGIHPPELAKMNADRHGEKYQPSNGTEGEIFTDVWCRNCARDRSMREGDPIEECDDDELCDIIARAFACDVDDPRYPVEWQYGHDGQPMCTAFVPAGEKVPPPKDDRTPDMFDAEARG